MSSPHFPSAHPPPPPPPPPPGTYVPSPNQAAPQQSPYPPYQQSQIPSPYGTQAPSYDPLPPGKSSAGLGQVFNQAVTTGKPLLNKFGKSLSSKFGNRPGVPATTTPTTPQHLESFQNYQNFAQQQQHPGQSYHPQQQQPWQPPSSTGPNLQGQHPQQSSYSQHLNYGASHSGHSGQNNPPPPPPPPPSSQTPPQQQSNNPGNSQNRISQVPNLAGQYQHGYSSEQAQSPQNQFSGQQTGVIGGSQPPAQDAGPQSPYIESFKSRFPIYNGQQPLPPPPPPEKTSSQPASPLNAHNVSPANDVYHTQPYGTAPQMPPNKSAKQQQWQAVSPTSPLDPTPTPGLASNDQNVPNPPPIHQLQQTQAPVQAEPAQSQNSNVSPSESSEFVAELPADMGKMGIITGDSTQRSGANGQYQAYQPPGAGQRQSPSSQSFRIPRRAVSTSSLPVADPWRVADAATELPTREFYMIADLLFDAVDGKFEPQGTGFLEAGKLLAIWPDINNEVVEIFSWNSYTGFAKMWSLQGIPHVMVPNEACLTPACNFSQHTHAQEMRVSAQPAPEHAAYPTYIPALTRQGWYKHFFLELLHEPESLEKLLTAHCADTYRPGVLNQPNVQRWDRAENAELKTRVACLRDASVKRVCQEVVTAMSSASEGR